MLAEATEEMVLVREGPPTKQDLSRWLEEPVPDQGNGQDEGGNIHGWFEEYPRQLDILEKKGAIGEL